MILLLYVDKHMQLVNVITSVSLLLPNAFNVT